MCQRCSSAVLVEPLPPGLTTRAIGLSVPMDSGSGLVSVQPLFELSRSKCGVDCAIRASESGLEVLDSHRSPPCHCRKPGLQPSEHVVQTGSCSFRWWHREDLWTILIAAQISPWCATAGPPLRSGPTDPMGGLEPC